MEKFPSLHLNLLDYLQMNGFRHVVYSRSRGGQYNGPCPWCGGHDRFRVQPHYGRYGWFCCNQCERRGSAVDYLMMACGFSKRQALETVGWTLPGGWSDSQGRGASA